MFKFYLKTQPLLTEEKALKDIKRGQFVEIKQLFFRYIAVVLDIDLDNNTCLVSYLGYNTKNKWVKQKHVRVLVVLPSITLASY